MVSVVGIAASSRENLDRQLDRLGTNLLRVSPGETLFGDAVHLPTDASAMIGRIDAGHLGDGDRDGAATSTSTAPTASRRH